MSAQPARKITVLASGQIRLDGRPVTLPELAAALPSVRLEGAFIHYDQESPTREADAVMKLIADNHLRIAYTPSNVVPFPAPETPFTRIRHEKATHRAVWLVRPDLTHFSIAAPPEGALNKQMVAGVKNLFSSDEPRNVAAIVPAGCLAGDPAQPPTLARIAGKVPFFGLLVGLAYIGHIVWAFEAIPSLLPDACEEADLLIVDSQAIATLPTAWAEDASRAMRNPNILIYDRTCQKIGVMRTAGEIPARIEFPN